MNDLLLQEAVYEMTDALDEMLKEDPEGAQKFLNVINKVFNNPLMKAGSCFIIGIGTKSDGTQSLQLMHTKLRNVDIQPLPLRINLQKVLDGLTDKAKEISENS